MANPNGFIKLHRKITEWEWYGDTVVKVTFLHILLTANYKETNYKGINLKPGQLVTTIRQLSEETGQTERQTRRALGKLKRSNEVSIKGSNKFSVITVENWAKYQSLDDDEVKQTVKQKVNQRSNKGQTNGQTNGQHKKNIKNKEYKNIINKGVYYIANSDEKNCYGKYNNVLLTPTEYEEVFDLDNGLTLDRFSERLHTRGYKYDDHYQAILSWYAEDKNKQIKHEPAPGKPEFQDTTSYDMDEFLQRAEQLPVYVSPNGADEN